MGHYFEVIFDLRYISSILVKAGDIIEAGKIAAEWLNSKGYTVCEESIIEIKRTDIAHVIE